MIKKRIIILLLFSLFTFHFSFPSFASGNKDVEVKRMNEEWILCITAFDYSLLPPARRLAGDSLTRNLLNKLNAVSYRLRIAPEYTYYESYAWQQAVNTAAKAVSAKQNERSQLLFRGDPEWKYRGNLKKIDADLEKLEATLAEKEAEKPLIHKEPLFKLTQDNNKGVFPSPPKKGTERRFCQNQKIDAFLTGEMREFHGRYYIHIMLFTLYTNSWVYRDDIIFSLEDSDGAVEEMAARLTAVLSGNRPATVAVTAEPGDAQILINRNYAGRGTVEAREHPPGKITIAVAAEGYNPETAEADIFAGELTEFNMTLSPLQYAEVNINTPGAEGAYVYSGALYVGKAPLTLSLPLNQLEYIRVENRRQAGKAVFTTPDLPTETFDLSLKMKTSSGEKKVAKARKWYYWAWGSTWVAGIAAWITYGIYDGQFSAWQVNEDDSLRTSAMRMNYINFGTMISLGVVGALSISQIIRYLYVSTEDATPIVGRRKK